ncbi:hypothetical protein BH09SUM1_BH09SUM1_14800 [soil metagenome]
MNTTKKLVSTLAIAALLAITGGAVQAENTNTDNNNGAKAKTEQKAGKRARKDGAANKGADAASNKDAATDSKAAEAPAEGGDQPRGQRGTQGGPGGGRRGFDPAAMFDRQDANKDGVIEKSEFQGPEDFFARLDTDGDGKITKDESTKGFEAMRAQRGNGGGPGGPGGGNWGRGREVNLDELKTKLNISDEDWGVLKPKLEKATKRNPPGENSAMAELKKTLESPDAKADEIKEKVKAVREEKKKLEAERKADKDAVKELLSARQEAQLVADGILD